MKTWIHPNMHKTKVTCTCGASFEMELTMPELKVETCSKCHSFYTGEQKVSANASRVARFRARQEATQK